MSQVFTKLIQLLIRDRIQLLLNSKSISVGICDFVKVFLTQIFYNKNISNKMQKQKESHLKRQSMESMIPMSSANATLPATSSVSVQFLADPRKASSTAFLKFGTTAD